MAINYRKPVYNYVSFPVPIVESSEELNTDYSKGLLEFYNGSFQSKSSNSYYKQIMPNGSVNIIYQSSELLNTPIYFKVPAAELTKYNN